VRVKAGLLRGDAEEAFGLDGILEDVVTSHGDRARGGADEAGEHADGGGLACAVGAQEAEGLAGMDGEGDAVDDFMSGEDIGQLLDGYRWDSSQLWAVVIYAAISLID